MRDITFYGGVLNDTSAAARAANKQALISGWADTKRLGMGQGTLYLPQAAFIDIPQACGIEGDGRWEGQSAIKGDGNLFKITNAGGAESRSPFTDLLIANESVPGILLYAPLTADLGRVEFNRVNWGFCAHHIAVETHYAVEWAFTDNKFEQATSTSRQFSGVTALHDTRCNIGNNYRGLRLGDEALAVTQYTATDTIFQGNKYEGLYLMANGSSPLTAITLRGAWFENNGTQTGAADIQVSTLNAGTALGITIDAGTVFGPNSAAQATASATRIGVYEGGGAVSKIFVFNSRIEGTLPLAENTTRFTVGGNTHFGNIPQTNWRTIY